MFNLPLSKELDFSMLPSEEALKFTPYDRRRMPLTLTKQETLALIEFLQLNGETLKRALEKSEGEK